MDEESGGAPDILSCLRIAIRVIEEAFLGRPFRKIGKVMIDDYDILYDHGVFIVVAGSSLIQNEEQVIFLLVCLRG